MSKNTHQRYIYQGNAVKQENSKDRINPAVMLANLLKYAYEIDTKLPSDLSDSQKEEFKKLLSLPDIIAFDPKLENDTFFDQLIYNNSKFEKIFMKVLNKEFITSFLRSVLSIPESKARDIASRSDSNTYMLMNAKVNLSRKVDQEGNPILCPKYFITYTITNLGYSDDYSAVFEIPFDKQLTLDLIEKHTKFTVIAKAPQKHLSGKKQNIEPKDIPHYFTDGYKNHIINNIIPANSTEEENSKKVLETAKKRSFKEECQNDIDSWVETLTQMKANEPKKYETIVRMFQVISTCGMAVNNDDQSRDADSNMLPIASYLAGRGRVKFQVPEGKAGEDILRWILGGQSDVIKPSQLLENNNIFQNHTVRSHTLALDDKNKIVDQTLRYDQIALKTSGDLLSKINDGLWTLWYTGKALVTGQAPDAKYVVPEGKEVARDLYIAAIPKDIAKNNGTANYNGETIAADGKNGSLLCIVRDPSDKQPGGMLIELQPLAGGHSQSYTAFGGDKDWKNVLSKFAQEKSIPANQLLCPSRNNGMNIDITADKFKELKAKEAKFADHFAKNKTQVLSAAPQKSYDVLVTAKTYLDVKYVDPNKGVASDLGVSGFEDEKDFKTAVAKQLDDHFDLYSTILLSAKSIDDITSINYKLKSDTINSVYGAIKELHDRLGKIKKDYKKFYTEEFEKEQIARLNKLQADTKELEDKLKALQKPKTHVATFDIPNGNGNAKSSDKADLETEKLRRQNDNLLKLNQDFIKTNEQLIKKRQELETLNATLKQEAEKAKSTAVNPTQKAHYEKLEKDNTQLTNEIAGLKTQLQTAQEKLSKSDSATLQGQIKTLEKELKTAQENLVKFNEARINENDDLVKQRDQAIKETKDSFHKAEKNLMNQIGELEIKLENANSTLKKTVQDLEAANKSLGTNPNPETIATYQKKVQELQGKLKTQQDENTKKDDQLKKETDTIGIMNKFDSELVTKLDKERIRQRNTAIAVAAEILLPIAGIGASYYLGYLQQLSAYLTPFVPFAGQIAGMVVLAAATGISVNNINNYFFDDTVLEKPNREKEYSRFDKITPRRYAGSWEKQIMVENNTKKEEAVNKIRSGK